MQHNHYHPSKKLYSTEDMNHNDNLNKKLLLPMKRGKKEFRVENQGITGEMTLTPVQFEVETASKPCLQVHPS
jgi:hypothetical protein